MKKEEYVPVRRTEKPVFQEIIKNGETTYEPIGREIIFEAVKME
jgi:hypothetical protein